MHLRPAYRPDIDGLRAVAVLAVIAYHAFPEWVSGGFVGVDVFFVISGFLISTILFENLSTNNFSFVEFYSRRIRRLFPALITVLIACFAFGWLALLPNELERLGKHIAGGAGFVSNFVLWSESGYFDTSADTKPLLHLWSLGVEEQFYIVFPFLLWAAWRRGISLLVVTLAVAVASFAVGVAVAERDTVAAFYSPVTRFWELMCGSLLAWVTLKYGGFPRWDTPLLANTISALGVLLIAFGVGSFSDDTNFPGAWALFPVVGSVLVLAAGPASWVNRHILSNRAMVGIGLISYPLYLWHWPLLSYARIMENGAVGLDVRVSAVLLSFVLAWITYRFIERPIRFADTGQNAKAMSLASGMSVVGLIGLVTFASGGFIHRIDGPTRQLNALISEPYPDVAYHECEQVLQGFDRAPFDDCLLSDFGDPAVLVLGDSHAKQFRSTDWSRITPGTVLLLTQPECLPFSNDEFMGRSLCGQAFDTTLDFVANSPSLQTVVVAGFWAYLMAGEFSQTGTNWRLPGVPSAVDVESFERNGERLLSQALQANRRVVFMRDIPTLDFNVRECFDNRPLRLSPAQIREDCSISQVDRAVQSAASDAVLARLLSRFPEIVVYDPGRVLCDSVRCLAGDDTLPLYINGDHLNHYGARLVLEDFAVEVFGRE